MKPAPFKYRRPESLEEALEIFAELGSDAKALAGGQSLVPAMNFRLARPAVLVDLNRIASLAYTEEGSDGGLSIGAMTRQRAAERSGTVAAKAPLLFEALPCIAHPQIRSRGTIGGSLAHADPAAELPAVMVALDARLVLKSRTASRSVPAEKFYTGPHTTDVGPDELLTEVRIPPRPPRACSAFVEVARRHGNLALVGVAAELALDQRGVCSSARIGLLNVGDRPVLAAKAMAAMIGGDLNEASIEEAARIAAETVDPPTDIHASSAYRRHLVRVLVGRALTQAVRRAVNTSEVK
jgi:carbon-monoxide dehydrogenase medium subunit